jgi:hypothetical protein
VERQGGQGRQGRQGGQGGQGRQGGGINPDKNGQTFSKRTVLLRLFSVLLQKTVRFENPPRKYSSPA